MKVPTIANNSRLKRALQIVSPLVGIRSVETDGDHLYVHLRATPAGLREAIVALRSV